MIAAGIGCRRGIAAESVMQALAAALRAAGRDAAGCVATIPRRAGEAGVVAAARALGLPFVVPAAEALAVAAPLCLTRSDHALAITGLPSVAECAALAAAGPGARLLGPRVVLGGVTCALAEGAIAEGGA